MSIPAAFNVACDAASRMLQEVQASGLSISSEAIFLIVLATILGEFVLSELASFLNYRALDTPMPKEFDGIYKPDAYAESQRYTKAKTIFGLLNKSFDLALLLVFWLVFDGFELVDGVVRSAVPGDSAESPSLDIWRGLLYMAIFGVGEGVLGLPWSIYFTFVLEEKFGFNKTTAKTFVVDLLKGLMLGVVLGAPLMAAVLAFFIYSGDRAWWLCWCFIAAFQIVVMFVAPVLIFPLFNEFTPLPEGELKEAIARYATSVGFTYGGIFEIDGAPLPGGTSEPSDQQQLGFASTRQPPVRAAPSLPGTAGSKRSSHSNAFFTGFGSTKRIALFDTLLKQMSTTEILGVLAHEASHTLSSLTHASHASSRCTPTLHTPTPQA